MDLDLAPETRKFAEEMREWSVSELRPFAREADLLHDAPAGAVAAYHKRPFEGSPVAGTIRVPRLEGGEDGTYIIATTVTESGSYGDSIFMCLESVGIGAKVVRLIGTRAQIKKWGYTPNFTAFALTEPDSGSDAAALRTTAVPDKDAWVINGSKMFCSGGSQAEYLVVFATVDRSLGYGGIRAFVVPSDTPGFSVVKPNEHKLGMRAMTTSMLSFENVTVPDENCLGSDETRATAFRTALTTLNTTRHQVASIAIGISQAAIDEARPLLNSQHASFSVERWARIEEELASMNGLLHNSRLMVRNAAERIDRGVPFAKEASMAKAMVPPAAERIIGRILRILGPDGYSQEHLFEKWHRDVKIIDIWEGTGQVQRRTISRALMGHGSAAG